MAALSEDVTGVLTILYLSVQGIVIYLILLSLLLIGVPAYAGLIAPLRPTGSAASSSSVFRWLWHVFDASDADVLASGGVDALLHVRRTEMHRDVVRKTLPFVSVPLAIIYALNYYSGGSTETGFSRISLGNVMAGEASKMCGSPLFVCGGMARVWACCVGIWGATVLALRTIDEHDEAATRLQLQAVQHAPPQHYAVVVTGLAKGQQSEEQAQRVKAALAAIGSSAIACVSSVLALSTPVPDAPRGKDEEEEKPGALAPLGALLKHDGSVRARVSSLPKLLRAAKKADNAALKAQDPSKPPPKKSKLSKTPEELVALAVKARLAFERERLALVGCVGESMPCAGAAVVVFETLAAAVIATNAPLALVPMAASPVGQRVECPSPWDEGGEDACASCENTVGMTVTPAPEARDILWAKLESLPTEAAVRESNAATGRGIKLTLNITYSLILVGIEIAVLILLDAVSGLSPTVEVICAIVAAALPTAIKSFMLGFMATILAKVNLAYGGVWAQSQLERQTQQDYCDFFLVVVFLVPLLGASIFATLSEPGAINPVQSITLMAQNVPALAYLAGMLLLFKLAALVTSLSRIVPYVMYKLNAWLGATEAELLVSLRATPAAITVGCGWGLYAFVVAATYAPVAPSSALLALLYLEVFHVSLKYDLSNISAFPFDTNGSLWRTTVQQTHKALGLALTLQMLLVLSSGGILPFVLLIPLPVVFATYATQARVRHERQSAHGAAKGRLALTDADALDARRTRNGGKKPAFHIDHYWAPPEALPNTDNPNAIALILPGPPLAPSDDPDARFVVIDAWLRRHKGTGNKDVSNPKTTPSDENVV